MQAFSWNLASTRVLSEASSGGGALTESRIAIDLCNMSRRRDMQSSCLVWRNAIFRLNVTSARRPALAAMLVTNRPNRSGSHWRRSGDKRQPPAHPLRNPANEVHDVDAADDSKREHAQRSGPTPCTRNSVVVAGQGRDTRRV